jgi:hypothetical protein
MKKMWIRNDKRKVGLEAKVLLAASALAVVIGLGSGSYTAQAQTPSEPPSGQIPFFDPFRLTTIYVDAPQILSTTGGLSGAAIPLPTGVTEGNPGAVASSGVVVGSPVLIPQRKPIRSPFRPPWVPPGPPDVPPGPPPVPPGPPPF